MIPVQSLKHRPTALSAIASPGYARAVAEVAAGLCEHLATLSQEISALEKRMEDAEKTNLELRQAAAKEF